MNLISSFASTLGGSFQKQSFPQLYQLLRRFFNPPLHHLYWMLAMSNHFPSHSTFFVSIYFAMPTLTMFDINTHLQLSFMFITLDTRSWCSSRLFYDFHTGLYCLYRFFHNFAFKPWCFRWSFYSLVVILMWIRTDHLTESCDRGVLHIVSWFMMFILVIRLGYRFGMLLSAVLLLIYRSVYDIGF
jgi:hypothetical protein